MKLLCKELSCQNQTSFCKDGFYFRKSDSKTIQRYKCTQCGKRTSTAQLSSCFGQNKRTVNHLVEKLLCAKVSQKRIAKILNIDKKTVHRKLVFLGIEATKFNEKFRNELRNNKIVDVQIDDLITKEKTKLKPLTISVAIDSSKRKILAIEVGKIPSFGHLSKISLKKYGKRKSEHKKTLRSMFEKIQPIIIDEAIIKSDEHQFYPEFIEKYFPKSKHMQFKSIKGTVAGQGELKKSARDPLYEINHTFAMLRDNINRLVRKSWCVTQKVEMLQNHLEIYMKYHNTELVKKNY